MTNKNRHVLKYDRKTETSYCTCRQWRMKRKLMPWTHEPSPELVASTEHLLEEFEKHIHHENQKT